MEAKFTPGPWWVNRENRIDCKIIMGPPSIDYPGVQEICCISGLSNETKDEANAHLIAAAPDLYEALKTARSLIIVMGYQSVGVEKTDKSLVSIEASIAKAEGRE